MKIAIVCPIGDLNRFGYWRVAKTCLQSWQTIGDLFLIHSSRTAIPFNIASECICDDGTLMQMQSNAERFDYRIVAANANRGLEAARRAGYDVAIVICVNWYIEAEASLAIMEKCRYMLRCNNDYGFLYRRLQMGGKLLNADLMSIAMINIGRVSGDVVKVLVDRIEIDGQSIAANRGDYADMNHEAYIDCEFELTIDELRDKLQDVRNYEDILPKRHGATWNFWLRYYQQRASGLTVSGDALGLVGQHIAASHPAGSFGDWMLEQMAVTA